jgi:murein DD-endopeptidase MepM/ murein hydrolase activator NlpD
MRSRQAPGRCIAAGLPLGPELLLRAWRFLGGGAKASLPILLLGAAVACGGGNPADPGNDDSNPPPPPEPPPLVWPLSGATGPDADSIHAPFGPRALPTAYDFHAGIDLPAATGTRVHAILPGVVVQVRTWDGASTGAGNAVLMAHEGGFHSSYLHLHTVAVRAGDILAAKDQVGTVGSTGASYSHLHLGYFKGLPGASADERYAHNPLEVLPFTPPSGIQAGFVESSVVVSLPLQRMTVQRVILLGEGQEAAVDYYQVLLRGSVERDEHVQNGVYLDAGRPSGGRFDLTVRPVAPLFVPDRIVLLDFLGDTVFQATR